MERFRKLKKLFFSRSFLLYSLIGTVNTLNTAALSGLLSFLLEDNVSSYLGYILSLSIGYFLNAKFNFKRKIALRQYLRFMASYVPNFLIYTVISTIAISVFDWTPFFSAVLAAVLGVPATFVLMKFFAFSGEKYSRNAADEDF